MERTPNAAENPSSEGAVRATDDRGRRSYRPAVWSLGILAFILYGVMVKPLEWIRTAEDAKFNPEKDGQTLLWMICEYPLLVATIGAVLSIVAGVLGSRYGLPGLFRDPPPVDLEQEGRRRLKRGYVHSRGGATAFFGALGATFLTALVWTVVFYSEIFEKLDLFSDGHILDTQGYGVRLPLSDAGFWYHFVWDVQFWNHGDLLLFLFWTCLPFLFLFLLAEVFPASSAPGLDRSGGEFLKENLRFASGMVVGVILVIGLAKGGALLHAPAERLWDRQIYPALSDWPVLLPGQADQSFSFFKLDEFHRDRSTEVQVTLLAAFSSFIVVTGLFYVVFAVAFRRSLSPGLGICILLDLGILAYSVLAQLSTAGQIVCLGVLLVYFLFANGGRYKYRFPGMGTYYRKDRRVRVEDLEKALSRPAEDAGLLRDETVLTNWHEATGQDRPKLVLIATTGGAYRASFWTTVVLDELNRCLGRDFHRHIRLITGASGGMVGAAYFVSALTEAGPPEGGVTELLRDETGLDSLTPVVRQLILDDLPRAFWPFPQDYDRGVELEQQWAALAKTFPELSEGEKAGWRPSLVVSPMVVESGRRILISNLDLSRLAETKPLVPVLVKDQGGPEAQAARIYSRSAVEFFRIFPDARPTFSLQTAIRMSATFPFATPAVTLPTDLPRRVVDAGYYDNYGVDLATSWIYVNQDWIREHTSGVALIQIRAYPSEEEIQSYFGLPGTDDRSLVTKLRDRLVTSFQGLSSPLAGGLSAREASMRFRNATQVRVLDDLLNRHSQPRLFETFVFENFADFAMNWFLTDQDIATMHRGIGAPASSTNGESGSPSDRPRSDAAQALSRDQNLKVKDQLMRWWGSTPVA